MAVKPTSREVSREVIYSPVETRGLRGRASAPCEPFDMAVHLSPFTLDPGGGPGTPTDLVTSEVTHYSFRATWIPPDEPVERFRIEYVPKAGGDVKVVSKP